MNNGGLTELSLETVGGGVAHELFERELKNVLENIDDINTLPKDKRVINLQITFQPTEQRDAGMISVICSSKLAGTKASMTPMNIVKRNGQTIIYQNIVKQAELNFNSAIENIETDSETFVDEGNPNA